MSDRRYFAAIAATSLPWLIQSSVSAARLSEHGAAERTRASNSRSRASSKFGVSVLREAIPWDAIDSLSMSVPKPLAASGQWNCSSIGQAILPSSEFTACANQFRPMM
jgi:hypothetical protein